jgi:hypothetical protein
MSASCCRARPSRPAPDSSPTKALGIDVTQAILALAHDVID